MNAISDLPVLHDMDADYSPQYVKLARIIRDKITSGEYKHGDPLPAAQLITEHEVSVRVVAQAMDMLAANRYVHRRGRLACYVVIWQADALCGGGSAGQMYPTGAGRHRRREHPRPAPGQGGKTQKPPW